MTRQAANYEILNKLYAVVEQHPDWRFHQILQNLDVNLRDVTEFKCLDQFYEESEETLERVNRVFEVRQEVRNIVALQQTR
jgi:hypothetical protein